MAGLASARHRWFRAKRRSNPPRRRHTQVRPALATPAARRLRLCAPMKRAGFTLIELLTVVAIIGLLAVIAIRSEEHTSELQSRLHLVCRLLLEKKKQDTSSCRYL